MTVRQFSNLKSKLCFFWSILLLRIHLLLCVWLIYESYNMSHSYEPNTIDNRRRSFRMIFDCVWLTIVWNLYSIYDIYGCSIHPYDRIELIPMQYEIHTFEHTSMLWPITCESGLESVILKCNSSIILYESPMIQNQKWRYSIFSKK